MILGDFGAEVIKVEKRGGGDPSRAYAPFYKGESTFFISQNRNKKGVTLDFQHKDAHEILLKFIKVADVLVENFKPGGLEKMGLAPDDLLKINPGLVITRITGFGQGGPGPERARLDPVAQTASGLLNMNRNHKADPLMCGISVTDFVTGVYGAVGTLAALQYRERTGKGQVVDVALMDVSTSLMLSAITNYYQLGIVAGRAGAQDQASRPANVYTAKDGKQVYMHIRSDEMFMKFCGISGNESLAKSGPKAKSDEIFQKWMQKHDSDEAIDILQANGISAARMNHIEDTARDPQLLNRGTVLKVVDSMLGEMMITGPVVKMSKSDPDVYQTAPYIGRDNYEVYRKVLGMTIEEIGRMEDEGLI